MIDWQALDREALVLFWQGCYEESAQVFEHLRGKNNDRARLAGTYGLGYVRSAQGRLEDATAHFREVVRQSPHHADALYMLGKIAERRANPGEALLFYGRALDAHPRHAGAKVDMARLNKCRLPHDPSLRARLLRVN